MKKDDLAELFVLPGTGEPVYYYHVEGKHEEEERKAGFQEPVKRPSHPAQPEQPHQLQ